MKGIISEQSLREKERMLQVGGEVYERVGLILKSKLGALEIAAELIGDLARLSDLIRSQLVIKTLDPFNCNLNESRPITALYTLREFINNMKLMHSISPEAYRRDPSMLSSLVTEVWTMKALCNEAYKSVSEYVYKPAY